MTEDYDKYPAPTEEELNDEWDWYICDPIGHEISAELALRLIHDIRCLRRKLAEYETAEFYEVMN